MLPMSIPSSPQPAPKKPGRMRSFLNALLSAQRRPGELVIVSHSNLFYWWPVWLVGFLMAGITYFEGTRMAIVPAGTEAMAGRLVEIEEGQPEKRDLLVLPRGSSLPVQNQSDDEAKALQPNYRMADSRRPGVLFAFVILLVIAVTNIPLRGLWSLLTVLVLVLWAVILAQLGLWETIFAGTRLLAIQINLAGYLFISLSLFIIWLIGFLFFDRQVYVIITPGQVRVHLEIGGGETAYDSAGMVFQKRRSDLFRHWILGFGSGDLLIRPSGGKEHIDLPNVMMVTRRVREIEQLIKERQIVAA
jgi:hypothetical protein